MFRKSPPEPMISLAVHRQIVADYLALLKCYRDQVKSLRAQLSESIGAISPAKRESRPKGKQTAGSGVSAAPPSLPFQPPPFGDGWSVDDQELYQHWCREQGDLTPDVLETLWLETYGHSAPMLVLSA